MVADTGSAATVFDATVMASEISTTINPSDRPTFCSIVRRGAACSQGSGEVGMSSPMSATSRCRSL
jgi:hypothetical protein